MSIFVALNHVTHYHYDRPIDARAADHPAAAGAACRTPILSYSLKVTPTNHFVNWQQDPHGNWLARFVFPENGDRAEDRGRPHRRDDGDQSVRLLRRALCRDISLRLSRRPEERTRALSGDDGAAGRCFTAYLGRASRRKRRAPSTSSSISTRSLRETGQLRHPHGARRPDAGGDPAVRLRLVPRQRLAAGPDAAPSRPRRALRLRLSDPAAARHRSARRSARGREPTSPTCTPGPRSISPAPAGSASTPPRAC